MERMPLFMIAAIMLGTGAAVAAEGSRAPLQEQPPARAAERPDCAMQERLHAALKDCTGGQCVERSGRTTAPANPPDPYLDPALKQAERYKHAWWTDEWAPPDESNPYHSWKWDSK